jgi:outer membrane biosynthesis protein TonB
MWGRVAELVGDMRRKSNVGILVAFLALAAMAVALTVTPTKQVFGMDLNFVPPDVLTAGEIVYPPDSLGSGIVTLSINLDEAGQIQNVQVLRDIPSLTDPAVAAVKSWTFTPGKLDGKPVASSLNVSVVFNPGNPQTHDLDLAPLQPTPTPNPPGYLPPEIAAASYAIYPINSVATGTVVLDATIGKSGEIKKLFPIRPVPSLTSAAISAVKKWTINAATFHGKAITSTLIIAFVFRPPTVTTP